MIDKLIELGYKKENRCVVFTDLSKFTKQSFEHGIEIALVKLNEVTSILEECTRNYDGQVVKSIGDSMFLTFDTVDAAFKSVIEMHRMIDEYKLESKDEFEINLCAGIGYGECYIDKNGDCFGNEVNLASKLGEDVAKAREILFTKNAYIQLNLNRLNDSNLNNFCYEISNIKILAYRCLYENCSVD